MKLKNNIHCYAGSFILDNLCNIDDIIVRPHTKVRTTYVKKYDNETKWMFFYWRCILRIL